MTKHQAPKKFQVPSPSSSHRVQGADEISVMWLDYILLLVLVLLTIAAAFRRVIWVRIVAAICLFGVALFFEMGLDAMARAVISKRTREGRWTREYVDGVYDMEKWTRTFRPYRLIAVVCHCSGTGQHACVDVHQWWR